MTTAVLAAGLFGLATASRTLEDVSAEELGVEAPTDSPSPRPD